MVFGLIWALVACTDKGGDDTASEAVDLRGDFPAPPEGGIQFLTPDMTIEPYTEKLWCFFDTYEGEDVAIVDVDTYQSQYGHHVQLLSTKNDPDEYPDGMAFDCTDRETLPMTDMDPIYIAVPESEGRTAMHLEDGMGVELESGTRIVIQSHYLNTSAEAILVNDAINIGVTDPESVETWAAPFAHVLTDMPLPPGQATSLPVDCAFEGTYEIMYVGGHMHEWGTTYSIDHVLADGTSTERIYEVETWDALYRDQPPMNSYAAGERTVQPGDRFVTTCNWFNDTDEELNFPEEMCATFGMLYPSKVPLICDPS